MPEHEETVLESFRAKVARGDTSGIKVSVHVAGGMPGEQHVDRQVVVDGSGEAMATTPPTEGAAPAEAHEHVEEAALVDMMRKLGEGAEGLVPRSRARFLPDSVVGSVVVEVDGQTTELFYLADEEDRITQGKPIPPSAAEALASMQRMGDRMLGGGS